ncbi:DUF2852 domain-containing protein [Terrarubrum flagellatum]|uniref:DUF2852 domain-containing protein n=1 Tax=Terrirubrum flagellatum TaxID=2895980 RepID=UPI0031455C06
MSDFSSTANGYGPRFDHYAPRPDHFFGRAAWIALIVLAFIVFWPLGLALLIITLRRGPMSCGYGRHGAWNEDRRAHWERKMQRIQEKMARWGGPGGGFRSRGFAPTGNRAFDEYRDQMMQRLEDEAKEFQDFLSRLRAARDKQEFDQYMADRQRRNDAPPPGSQEPPQQPSPPTN